MERSEKLFERHIQSAVKWINEAVGKLSNDNAMKCLCYDVKSNAFRISDNENLGAKEILVERVVKSEISNEPYPREKILAAKSKIVNLI